MRRLLTVLVTLGALAGCATPDFDYPREAGHAIEVTADSTLHRYVDDWLGDNPGPSGFFPLQNGTDALGARLRLMELAERSIDAQYFLIKNDRAGYLFLDALIQAADRGVRVRILVDDIFSTLEDREIAIVAGHENIEFRLYNPIARRGIRMFNYLGDFERANRRMHNKSFIVDNQVAVVGGRNIADEYFELREDGEFLDFDMLVLGPVVADVSVEFDSFWNHERALPAEAVVGEFDEQSLNNYRSELEQEHRADAHRIHDRAINTELLRDLSTNDLVYYSADASVLNDDPDKLLQEAGLENATLIREIADLAANATSEVIVLSPYFVPGNDGAEFWASIARRGVRVVIITNSLASTNHTSVHSAYARYRSRLLEAGVEIYEARADAAGQDGERSLTLHTKSMIFDRRQVFVGSLNLDPRSIEINSEMGMVVESPALGRDLSERLFSNLGKWTYRLSLDDDGNLSWHATIDGVEVVESSEPLASGWRRFSAWFLKVAPEKQL